VVLPAAPGFYHRPQQVRDLVDFVVQRVLDHLGSRSISSSAGREVRLGVISDTHGLLRPEVFEVFKEVDHILHAGDVGKPEILIELEAIAPVTAVYGNVDPPELRSRLPQVAHSSSTASISSSRTGTSSAHRLPRSCTTLSPKPRSSCTGTPTSHCSSWWTAR